MTYHITLPCAACLLSTAVSNEKMEVSLRDPIILIWALCFFHNIVCALPYTDSDAVETEVP